MTKEEAIVILHCRRVAYAGEHLALYCELDLAQLEHDTDIIAIIRDNSRALAAKFGVDEVTVRALLESAK